MLGLQRSPQLTNKPYSQEEFMHRIYLSLWVPLLLLTGCVYTITAPNTGTPAGDPVATTAADSPEVLLTWQGYSPAEGEERKCQRLQILADNQVQTGDCDTDDQPQPLPDQLATEWATWQTRMGTFTLEDAEEQLTVQGQGTEIDEAWQRALLRWSRLAHDQVVSGRVSAAGPTSLSWFLEPSPTDPELCQHLTVLAYGYAYAQLVPCSGGGAPSQQYTGWLTSEELSEFDGWLYTAQPLYVENNYLAGEGEQPLDEAEIAEVEGWAAAVYERIQAEGTVTP
jgi:hypothetical protein